MDAVRYRAALFDGSGLPLRLVEQELPPLGPGERLVRVTACTICGSDLHTLAGRRSAPTPSILGHEALGIDVATGERVTWSLMASCGECPLCRRGVTQKCERLFKYGHARHTDRPSGGLSEYCVLRPGTTVLPVPDALPDEVACPANCATATVAACLRLAGDVQGAEVLIQGAGLLGLTATAMAIAARAAAVHVVDPDPARRAWAQRFGATHTYDSSEPLPTTDVAIELSGRSTALPPLAIGGRYILAGAVFPAAGLALDPEVVVRRLLRIEGIHNYTAPDLITALSFLTEHHERFPFAALVPRRFALSAVNEALAYVESTRPPRVLVAP